jgi:hypothetical protein
MKDYYAILGVRERAGASEIKRAYRMLAVKYHPDKNPSPAAEELFKEINEAYDVLGDSVKKLQYDNRWQSSVPVYEEVVQDQQNDDPRYRRKRPTHFKPASHSPTIKDLMRDYHSKVLWINYAALALILLLTIDYFLPLHQNMETINKKTIHYEFSTGKRQFDYDAVETYEGTRLRLYDHIGDHFEIDGRIVLYRTPVFSTVRAVVDAGQRYNVLNSGIYGPIGFFPLILLGTAILGVFLRKDTITSFNFSIASATLLFITICLIFAL